jgi:hypothetical protein
MSLKAYKAAQVATEDPRVTEYRLFGQVTGALAHSQAKPPRQGPAGGSDGGIAAVAHPAADCMDDATP